MRRTTYHFICPITEVLGRAASKCTCKKFANYYDVGLPSLVKVTRALGESKASCQVLKVVGNCAAIDASCAASLSISQMMSRGPPASNKNPSMLMVVKAHHILLEFWQASWCALQKPPAETLSRGNSWHAMQTVRR